MKKINFMTLPWYMDSKPVNQEMSNLEKLCRLCWLKEQELNECDQKQIMQFGIYDIFHLEGEEDIICEEEARFIGSLWKSFFMPDCPSVGILLPGVAVLHDIRDPFAFLYYAIGSNVFRVENHSIQREGEYNVFFPVYRLPCKE